MYDYLKQGQLLNLSKKTLKNREEVLSALFKFLSGRSLTLETAREYVDSLYKKGNQVSTITCHIKIIRAYANFKGYNWIRELKKPKSPQKHLDLISAELMEQVILAGAMKESVRLCLRFMLRTGLRTGEVLSLTSEDLNLEDNPPSFRVRSKGGSIDILPFPVDMPELKNIKGKLFKTCRETLNHSLQRGAELLKIKTYVHNHLLRHIFATDLLKSGISPAIVQRLMRHKSFEITNQTYSHYIISDLSQAMNSMKIIRSGLSPAEVFDSVETTIKKLLDQRFSFEVKRSARELVIRIKE